MRIEAAVRAIEELSALLRRELASVAAYEEALETLGAGGTSLAALGEMKREHARNARTLRSEIARLGGTSNGSAGVFSAFGDDSANRDDVSDEAAVLRSLVSCEERALRTYEDAAERLPAPCGALVWEVLVPARRRHVAALRHLVRLVSSGHGDCTSSRVAEGSRMSLDAKEVAI